MKIDTEFGHLLASDKAAEVPDSPRHIVALLWIGGALLAGSINARKQLVNQQLPALGLPHQVVEILPHREEDAPDEEIVLGDLAVR